MTHSSITNTDKGTDAATSRDIGIRIGLGVDIHKFLLDDRTRPMVLGGVIIPDEVALDGHSDADILFHALADAILGALALPDIGEIFPNTDPANQDLNSKIIVDYALKKMRDEKFLLANLDACLIAEKPKLSTYKEKIRHSISERTGLPINRIGLKGSTSEKMGALGRREGILCLVNVLLVKNPG